MKNLPGFVDSAVIEDDEPIELSSDNEDDEPVNIKRNKKRKRPPSPSPPPLDAIMHDELADESFDESIGCPSPYKTPITLQFNIPLGFHGPLVVKLDRNLLINTAEGVAHNMWHGFQSQSLWNKDKTATSKFDTPMTTVTAHKTGFCDLPPELRNNVYRYIFVNKGSSLRFPPTSEWCPETFCRSAQFLRTCRLVHSEGCSILYGENKFWFERTRTTRGPFWEPIPKEIGYKDVRQFLKMVGPENLAYFREVRLDFEDASQTSTPYLISHEDRRYLNDEHLIDCLRILSRARLRKITLGFFGRRALTRSDTKFVDHLERIKADEVDPLAKSRIYYMDKIHSNLWSHLKERMTRKTKLYARK